MFKDSRIYVAGHTGLLGSALIRQLQANGFCNILTRTRAELDLADKAAVKAFFESQKPDYVFLSAGKVGGILGNSTYPADYLHTNLAIQDNVFEAANACEVKHLVFYGSSCTYPKLAPQPIREDYFLTGPIELTSQGYAAAKIAGITACKVYNQQYKTNRFIALVPNSMFGPNDDFDLNNCHVLSALIRKFHDAKAAGAKSVTLWGTGTPRREFIYADDAARASIFAVENADRLENSHYNLGTGSDYSIKELAEMIASTIGYTGEIQFDTTKPDGAPRKLLDSSRLLALGFKPQVGVPEGIKMTCRWYQENCQ